MALNNVPLPGQSLLQTRDPINNNFSTIDTAFSVDHVPYQASGEGKHNQVQFPRQAGNFDTTGTTDVALFATLSPYTGETELRFANENGGNIIEFTSSLAATVGWTRLPSGILIKWGEAAATAGVYTYTYPVAGTIPAFVSVFQVLISTFYVNAADGNGFVRMNQNISPAQFSVYASQRTTTTPQAVSFSYLAIGF